jgi:hypothetical protein
MAKMTTTTIIEILRKYVLDHYGRLTEKQQKHVKTHVEIEADKDPELDVDATVAKTADKVLEDTPHPEPSAPPLQPDKATDAPTPEKEPTRQPVRVRVREFIDHFRLYARRQKQLQDERMRELIEEIAKRYDIVLDDEQMDRALRVFNDYLDEHPNAKRVIRHLDQVPEAEKLATATELANVALLGVLNANIAGAEKPTMNIEIKGNRHSVPDFNPNNGGSLGAQQIDYANNLNYPFGDSNGLKIDEIRAMIAQPDLMPGLETWLVQSGYLKLPEPGNTPQPEPPRSTTAPAA